MRDVFVGMWPECIFSFLWAGLGITWILGSPVVLTVREQAIDCLTLYSWLAFSRSCYSLVMTVTCYGMRQSIGSLFHWMRAGCLFYFCLLSCVYRHLAGGCLGSRRAAPWSLLVVTAVIHLTMLQFSPISHVKRPSPQFDLLGQFLTAPKTNPYDQVGWTNWHSSKKTAAVARIPLGTSTAVRRLRLKFRDLA